MSEKSTQKKHRRGRTVFLVLLVIALLAAIPCLGSSDGPLQAPREKLRRVQYPQELRELAEKNPDAQTFVAQYPSLKDLDYRAGDISLDADHVAGEIPHLMQWDLRWGYAQYGNGMLGLTGCGPTCLSMVTVGLTGNTQANPLAVANYSDAQGWYVEGAGSSWELMRSGAEHYGLQWRELPLDENLMRRALADGAALILSMLPGDFTESGHFIVVDGCTADGFTVLDPNSFSRSRVWSFPELSTQIGNIWAYSA